MNILYIMNVDWNWIKQRPHFLAEELEKYFKVKILYQHRYKRKGFQKRKLSKAIMPVFVIPKGEKNFLSRKINSKIWSMVISLLNYIEKYQYIYITFPSQIEYVKNFKGKLIYDCMDNHCAFIQDEDKKNKLIDQERKLVNKATIILCSSNKLKEQLLERYGKKIESKIQIVRNGYDGKILENSLKSSNNDHLVISYVGTISNWFDFETILKSTVDFPDIEYRLYGPYEENAIPKNIKNIKFMGVIEHDKIFDYIKNSDCLIMPFKVNDIIEAVDPVKLYEYINYNKNIISVYYKEIERFKDFVYFYKDYEGLKKILQSIIVNNQIIYNQDQRKAFLLSNTWSNRGKEIKNIILNDYECRIKYEN